MNDYDIVKKMIEFMNCQFRDVRYLIIEHNYLHNYINVISNQAPNIKIFTYYADMWDNNRPPILCRQCPYANREAYASDNQVSILFVLI